MRLNSWFEIDEIEYCQYILSGYSFYVTEQCVQWMLNDLWHREGGPATIWKDSTEVWAYKGKCHREDGPAITYASGSTAYYLHGDRIKKRDFKKMLTAKKKVL